MLDSSYATKENAIEEIVYDFLKSQEKVEMSKESAETFIMIGLMPSNVNLPKEEKPFIFQLIEKRVEHCFTFKFTDERAILTLCVWAESAGNAVMYLWYIQAWCFKNNVKEVDFLTLGMKIFPTGIFSEEMLKSAWQRQKVKNKEYGSSSNLLDYAKAGNSLQFKKSV